MAALAVWFCCVVLLVVGCRGGLILRVGGMLTVFPCSSLLVIDEVHQCAEYVDGSHDCSELSVNVANISTASGFSHLKDPMAWWWYQHQLPCQQHE